MTVIHAVWEPGWYELDQPLQVGGCCEHAFFRPLTADEDAPLKFYNTLWRHEDAVAATGTVRRIAHRELGQLAAVRTTGLDYMFVLLDGVELVVDAEEDPGRLVEIVGARQALRDPSPTSWILSVKIVAFSELAPAPKRLRRPGTPKRI